MITRLATLADVETIASMLRGQFEEHGIQIDDAALHRAIRGPLESPGRGSFLLAGDDPSPLGFAYLAYTWTLEHGGKSAWLEELYVLPSARERGIGTALLGAVIAHARSEGCAAIDLEVEESHERASRLYARGGFTSHRRARWFKKLTPK
jgi:GNAT superfamily N-acetyltransferase